MTRWLVAVVAAVLVILSGYVLFLNPGPVTVHLTPARSVQPPLAGALLAAFAAGGVLVGLAAGVGAGRRGWHRWRARRRARHEVRQATTTARARELVWAGDYAQARAELLRGGGKASADVARIVLLAETYLHEGDPASARKLLEEGLVEVGLEPRLLDLLADAAERSGDLRGAADALERARMGQPASPRLARRLRDVYAASGRWAEAGALQGEMLLRVREPATLAAEEQVLRGLRYQAALAEPDLHQSVRLLAALAREDRSFVPAWVSLGDALVRLGRPVAARRAWERGARRRPAAVLLERLERLNVSERKPERTTRLYRRLFRRHGAAPALSLLFARHLIAQGALDQANDRLSALAAPLAGHPLAHALWGELHRRRGNHNLAADTLARAVGPDLGVMGPFRCTVCRHASDAWEGYCPECRRWGTYQARVERAVEGRGSAPSGVTPPRAP